MLLSVAPLRLQKCTRPFYVVYNELQVKTWLLKIVLCYVIGKILSVDNLLAKAGNDEILKKLI